MTVSNIPNISVVIPVKNGMPEIIDCIKGINAQSIPVAEIIAIDSGSTDGTCEFLQSVNNVKLYKIESSEFNHGKTRNFGYSLSTGDYILFTVQDARAYNEFWIEELLKGFVDDAVVGVCGHQVVPHQDNTNPAEWYRPVSSPSLKRVQFTNDDFIHLSPAEKKVACSWDNVSAMYKRLILNKISFLESSYGEDALWAKQTLEKGFALVYNSAAIVYHFHYADRDYTFKRTLTVSYLRYKLFELLPEKNLLKFRDLLVLVYLIFFKSKLNFRTSLSWFFYNIRQHKAHNQAIKVFKKSLLSGEKMLDDLHQKLCDKPPIPLKAI
jgi:rhamnosyltransferase